MSAPTPTPAPRGQSVAEQPATVADCRADYATAQAARVWQDHRDDANVRR